MTLTKEHINLTLGINLPLNESFNLNLLNEDLKKQILFEQLLYESFIDSIKNYAKEKWDKAVDTIKDWKDAAVILGKVISDSKILQNFSDNFWKTFKSGLLIKIKNILKKLNLDKFIPQIENLVNKITSLTGWKKFLAAVSIASITEYIISKISEFSAEGLTKWIQTYFSDPILSKITDKLTDFTSYVSWLQPIIKGTEILFNVLKPTIEKFKFAFNLKPAKMTENKMKKSQLHQLIREEIQNILEEDKYLNEVASSNTPKLQGSQLNLALFKELAPNINPQFLTNTINLVKQNKTLNNAANKTLAELMIAMIKTSDDNLLNKIFQNLKQMEVK
jgi:hypothetical protein